MLNVIPIERALWRRHLFLGGEREPVMLTAGLCVIMGGLSFNWVAIVVSVVVWLVAIAAFRWMAKCDPRMFAIYRRSLKYRAYYPPYTRPYVRG